MSVISFLASLTTFFVLIPATFCRTYLFEGEACELRDKSEGICGTFADCGSAFSFPRNPPELCSTRGDEDIICCPPEYIKKPTTSPPKQRKKFEDTDTCSLLVDRDPKQVEESLSGKACQMYEDTFNDNSEVRHMVGGVEVKDMGEFPFMAALGYASNVQKNGIYESKIVYNCGGMLISDRFVLTAAHCETEQGPVEVKMGAVKLTEYHRDAKVFEVEKFIAHPCYNMTESYYDIALVKLSKPIRVSNYIFPACIFKEPEPQFDKMYNVTGWGATTLSGFRPSNKLLAASLAVMHPDNCSSKWQPDKNTLLPRGFAENTMLCAINPVKGATCKGDSGGPLSLGIPNVQFTVIGVISQGASACGDIDKPGIITNIYPFLLWIEDVIWPNGNITPLEWHDE